MHKKQQKLGDLKSKSCCYTQNRKGWETVQIDTRESAAPDMLCFDVWSISLLLSSTYTTLGKGSKVTARAFVSCGHQCLLLHLLQGNHTTGSLDKLV